MATVVFTRRAVVAFAALAAGGLGGCNTNQTAAVQPQAVSGFRIGNIAVNTAPLLAQSGDPTASLVQQALPGQLAQAFAAHMAPGDPSGATLSVRIDSVYLGGGGPADPDTMRGAATLSGGGRPRPTLPTRPIRRWWSRRCKVGSRRCRNRSPTG